jgi:hypothetical protein
MFHLSFGHKDKQMEGSIQKQRLSDKQMEGSIQKQRSSVS